jgi:anaerobic dimethyl sulfoxide reductase subunit B (iron-sulfur subunit)/Tat-targeted selenate reductase subunit YnfG
MTKQLGFMVDAAACNGCGTCAMACKSENMLPAKVWWRQLREVRSERPNGQAWLTMACNHCEDPACAKVCPVNAYSKRADGIVVQDHDACIGCRACVKACPFGAVAYDREEKKASKCTFCADRLDTGLQPRCVEACPSSALHFGEVAELRRRYGAGQRVADAVFRLPRTAVRPALVVVPPRTAKA